MKVIFEEKDHVYKYGEDVYTSVSGIFKFLNPKPFVEDVTSSICAFKDVAPDVYSNLKKVYGWENTSDIINNFPYEDFPSFASAKQFHLDSWAYKRELGTAFHKQEELKDIERGYCINKFNGKEYETIVNPTTFDNEAYEENMFDIKDGYYPEFVCFNHPTHTAGQIDKLFVETIDGVRYVDIDDWKSDGNIVKFPGFPFNKKLLFPFDNMYICNYSTYSIKLNIYAWMLAEAGFKIRDIRFTSVDINDKKEILSEKDYIVMPREKEVKYFMKKFVKSK